MQRIAVIGAGIAGLTVAFRRAAAGDRVVLFESSDRVGGQLWSEARGEFLIEHGAEGFVAGSEAVPRLAADVGLAEQLIEQLAQKSFSFDGRQLIELAKGEAARLLGFQVPNGELGRGIRSFRRGMGELPERLALELEKRIELRLGSPICRVAPEGRAVSVLEVGAPSQSFDAVVVATTARSAAALLRDAFGPVASSLEQSALLSSLTITLCFRRSSIAHPLDGTGFIVPQPEQLDSLRAVTFSSSKFQHRAPADQALLRLFFRPTDEDLRDLSDAAWAERGERALRTALKLTAPAESAVVSRWPRALPVFDDAHRARISALEAVLAPYPIWLAGAAYHGSGIDAAVRSAERAALAVSTWSPD